MIIRIGAHQATVCAGAALPRCTRYFQMAKLKEGRLALAIAFLGLHLFAYWYPNVPAVDRTAAAR